MPSLPRLSVAVLSALLLCSTAYACPSCRPTVEAGIFNETFLPNIALLLLPLALVATGAGAAYFMGGSEKQ